MEAGDGSERPRNFVAVADSLISRAHASTRSAAIFYIISVIIGFLVLFLFVFSNSNIPAAAPEFEIGVIASGILRFGAVVTAIFLIQVNAGFGRYYVRVAQHYASCADLIRLGEGDPAKIAALSSILLPSIEFGKPPRSPVETILGKTLETVSDLAKRIPVK